MTNRTRWGCLLLVALGGGCNLHDDPVLGVEGLRWQRTPRTGVGEGIDVDVEGNVAVSGVSDEEGRTGILSLGRAWVGKFDADGHEIWSRTFGRQNVGSDVAFDGASNLFYACTESVQGDSDIVVRKLDPDGVELWSRSVDEGGGDRDRAMGVATDADGNAFVTGTVDSGYPETNDGDPWLRKYDGDGNEIWTVVLPGLDDWASAVATDPDGNAIIVGEISVDPGRDWVGFVRKYDPSGTLSWSAEIGELGENSLVGVTTDASGNVYATGSITTARWKGDPYYCVEDCSHETSAIAAWKFAPDGTELWSTIGGGGVWDVALSGEEIFAAGEVPCDAGHCISIATYDLDGALSTDRVLDTQGIAFGLAPAPGGGVYATGSRWDGTDRTVWLARFVD